RPRGEHEAAQAQTRGVGSGHFHRREPHARLAGRIVVHDRFHRVDTRLQFGLAIEQHFTLLRALQVRDQAVPLVVLAYLLDDAVLAIEEADEHGEVGRVRLAVGRSVERQRRRLEIDDDGDEAGTARLREEQRRCAQRERVGHRLRLERAERRRLPRVHRRAAGIAHREIASARRDGHAGPADLDVDRTELAVELLVGRRVADQVVVAEIALDTLEALAQAFGAAERAAAGVPGQTAERITRILPQHVLVVLETLRQRPAAGLAAAEDPAAARARLVDLIADLRLLAFGAQAGGVHRVDADV